MTDVKIARNRSTARAAHSSTNTSQLYNAHKITSYKIASVLACRRPSGLRSLITGTKCDNAVTQYIVRQAIYGVLPQNCSDTVQSCPDGMTLSVLDQYLHAWYSLCLVCKSCKPLHTPLSTAVQVSVAPGHVVHQAA